MKQQPEIYRKLNISLNPMPDPTPGSSRGNEASLNDSDRLNTIVAVCDLKISTEKWYFRFMVSCIVLQYI
jgi:hypothetical protein